MRTNNTQWIFCRFLSRLFQNKFWLLRICMMRCEASAPLFDGAFFRSREISAVLAVVYMHILGLLANRTIPEGVQIKGVFFRKHVIFSSHSNPVERASLCCSSNHSYVCPVYFLLFVTFIPEISPTGSRKVYLIAWQYLTVHVTALFGRVVYLEDSYLWGGFLLLSSIGICCRS